MDEDSWPGEWLRGVLGLCVLAIVAEQGPQGTYGYAIARQLAEAGLGKIKGGTLYPILGRLEADGHVTATWVAGEGGPGRKSFVITEAGTTHLAKRRQAWETFVARSTTVMREGVSQ